MWIQISPRRYSCLFLLSTIGLVRMQPRRLSKMLGISSSGLNPAVIGRSGRGSHDDPGEKTPLTAYHHSRKAGPHLDRQTPH